MTPRHIAIIMDGNRRWARERNLPVACGYRRGVAALRATLEAASRSGVRIVTAYAFSEENWKRPSAEVDLLMALCISAARRELRALGRQGVRVRLCGRGDRLPPATRAALAKLVSATAGNETLTLNLAIDYGARREIGDAVRALAREVNEGLRDRRLHRRTRRREPPLHRRIARSRSRHPHRRRVAAFELPALPSRVRGVLGDAHVLARLWRRRTVGRTERFRRAPAPLRHVAPSPERGTVGMTSDGPTGTVGRRGG